MEVVALTKTIVQMAKADSALNHFRGKQNVHINWRAIQLQDVLRDQRFFFFFFSLKGILLTYYWTLVW